MRDFSSYEFEDFITDPSFINYAKETEPGDMIIWEDWLAKNPENEKTAEEAKNFINHLVPGRKSVPKKFIDNEWNRLCNRLDLEYKKVAVPSKLGFKIKNWHYAASIALLFSISTVIISKLNFTQDEPIANHEIIVPKGQIKNFLLPDGTLVYLNADTKLSYVTSFGKKNRDVTLEGEAYFDVTHNSNRPFIVHTRENDIKVLGTAFNVRAYPDGNIHQTSLEEGTIMISYQNEESHILNPEQTYLLIRDSKSSKVFRTEKVEELSSWTNGRIILRNHRFSDIAKDLERSHKVTFNIQNKQIINSRYTGEFSREDDIGKILEIISLKSDFEFEVARDTVTII